MDKIISDIEKTVGKLEKQLDELHLIMREES